MKNLMTRSKIAGFGLVLTLTGCATHATIEVPVMNASAVPKWQSAAMAYEILYSQPQPGMFTGGDQQAMKPLGSFELSVASEGEMKNLPAFVAKRLPTGKIVPTTDPYDYKLVMEMTAHDKKGPCYADYEFGTNFLKGMVSMGLASKNYQIVADFDVTYRLLNRAGETLATKSYQPRESVDHQRGDFEMINSVFAYAEQLLDKHVAITMDDFFQTASQQP